MSIDTTGTPLGDDELRLLVDYEIEVRAKYDTKDREEAAKKGEAMSGGSYPIKDEDDLKKAIHAVGRGNASHNAIRKHIIARAKALGLSSLIPDNWSADGSLTEAKASDEDLETRDDADVIPDPETPSGDCASCTGTGSVEGAVCTACDGSGTNPAFDPEGAVGRSDDAEFEWRKAKAEMLSSARTPERRAFDAEKMEIREDKDGGVTLTGYASVTETPYEVGFYTERMKRGAFKRTLKNEPDVVLLLNHGDGGSGLPLARTKSGTLTLEEDRNGLYVEASLDPLDPDAQLLLRKMKRGDLDGQMSFAFQAVDQDWSDDFSERTLHSVEINRGDVSIVTQGANPATSSIIRSLSGAIDEVVAMEQRAGRVLSSQNVETLKEILSLTANADENLDQIQPMLARLLGVANPDKPNEGDSDAAQEPDGAPSVPISSVATDGRSALPDFTVRAQQKLQALEMRSKKNRK